MRGPVLLLLLALTGRYLLAADAKLTDAERDGFKGVVKSVSTSIERFGRESDAANRPDVVYSALCQVCEYDEEGNSVKEGQRSFDGKFFGNTTRYVRDEDGSISEKILVDEKGALFQKIMIGPVGRTEELDYRDGFLQHRQTFRYDEHGNVIEWLTSDATGKKTASTTRPTTAPLRLNSRRTARRVGLSSSSSEAAREALKVASTISSRPQPWVDQDIGDVGD